MINFICPANSVYNAYNKVLMSFINPICKHLPNSNISDKHLEEYKNVSFFVEQMPHRDIFMPHGIADKNWRNVERVKDYDYIFVSGEAWVKKLTSQGVPKEKIFVGGYPKLDPLFNGEYKRNTYDKKVILFAPTHKAVPELSIADMDLSKSPTKYKLILSPHPAISQNNPTMQNLIDADVVISDTGSLVYEAWAMGKQVVFADWLVLGGVKKYFRNSFEDYIYTKQLGFHANDFNQLLELIDRALEESLSNEVLEFMEGILPQNLRGNSGKTTAEILKGIDV